MKKGLIKKFRENYSKHGQINIPGRDKDDKPIEKQTDWVWFDRETIEEALKKADADGKVGGLKMYFGQYNKETIAMIPADRPKREDYIGRISLVLVPTNKTDGGLQEIGDAIGSDDSDEEEEDGWNGGKLCPPNC
ncbi:hypothetical protein Belba_0636 [Belliella baltica DSM 15883]|uniref:Uncharacterized protein n=1 Tax=Belliella baltica (strain DSM 15883 / CIP 108006 / LMG 21964 / BA134) TaxID=866536 RepID=I3Z223_BELBD|nr:hypothetical protein [Belliella baltica]AFL83291.1 hypothetical protein Belba_0636 [Belliella baltica DSM 15883]